MKKTLIRIIITILLAITLVYIKYPKDQGTYYDNLEKAIILYYSGNKNDSLKYFNYAYKKNSKEDLLYLFVNLFLDEEDAMKFYKDKRDKSVGFDYFFEAIIDYDIETKSEKLEKSISQHNEYALNELYGIYYENYNFEKLFTLLEKEKESEVHKNSYDIFFSNNLIDKKDKLLKTEKLYNKYLNGNISEEERRTLGNLLISLNNYSAFVDAYDVLKMFLKEKDLNALFAKYITLESDTKEAKEIFDFLINKNYKRAIIIDIYENKNFYNISKDNEVNLYLANLAYDYDMWKLATKLYDKLEKYEPAHLYRARYYKNMGETEKAYEEYKKAYLFDSSYESAENLIELSIMLHKEKEALEITDNFISKYNEKRLLLEYKRAKLEDKKKFALAMWLTSPLEASKLLLEITDKKDKSKIRFYTNFIKQKN